MSFLEYDYEYIDNCQSAKICSKTRVVTALLESTFFAILRLSNKHLESSESARFSELDGLSRVPRRLRRDSRGHGGRASQALRLRSDLQTRQDWQEGCR